MWSLNVLLDACIRFTIDFIANNKRKKKGVVFVTVIADIHLTSHPTGKKKKKIIILLYPNAHDAWQCQSMILICQLIIIKKKNCPL